MYEVPGTRLRELTDDIARLARERDAAYDRLIELWHQSDTSVGPALHEFMGLTWDEYAAWVERRA